MDNNDAYEAGYYDYIKGFEAKAFLVGDRAFCHARAKEMSLFDRLSYICGWKFAKIRAEKGIA